MTDFRKKPTENIPSAARGINAFRDMGYTFHSAVGDIIDNSISHGKAKNIYIKLDYAADGIESFYIIDDGIGFPETKEDNVMKYGSDMAYDKENLGKYGVGLKSASTSMCKKLSVISKHEDDEDAHKIVWDLDHVEKTEKWETLHPHLDSEDKEVINKYFSNDTGTIVKWENIDRVIKKYTLKAFEAKAIEKLLIKDVNKGNAYSLKFYLEMTFQRFLDKEIYKDVQNINITLICEALNINLKLQPWDPFCRWSDKTYKPLGESKQIEFEFVNTDDSSVKDNINVDSYVVPYRQENSEEDIKRGKLGNVNFSGIYVYRNNRLIQYGSWLGNAQNEPHSSQARAMIDFNELLDEGMQIDVKKTRIILYPELNDAIWKQISHTKSEASNYKKNKNKEQKKSIHDSSNKIIKNKQSVLTGKFETTSIDKDKTELKNNEGTIIINHPTLPSKLNIETGDVKYRALWEPFFNENGDPGVRLNPDHPFYEKIYMKTDESGGSFIEGLDFIFISLISAELEEINEDRKKVFTDMRMSVSKKLEELVSDMIDPEYN